MNKIKTIAIIAHDNKKQEIIEWAINNKEILSKYNLCGTGTTAKRVSEATGLTVKGYLSGPLGGDQQIGAKAAEGEIDVIVFFCDPLQAQPHDPDVKALLRIANVYNVPIATNVATADLVISSPLM
jgi:methylglyoxal synthase